MTFRHHFSTLVALLTFACASTLLPAQEKWTTVASPTLANLWGATHGSTDRATSLFIAVGEAGVLLTSLDGQTWTPRSSGTARWLTAVASNPALFIAVGDAGTVLTSPDGLTWTPRATGTTQRLNAVAYGHGRWLAVGENDTRLSSPDGLTWTLAPNASSPSGRWLRGLTFAYGQFVATGASGTLLTTADAQNFRDRSLPASAYFEGLVYARRRFVATGSDGLVLTSADAVTWRQTSTAPATLRAVTFFNNVFVAASDHGTLFTSPDATTWTPRATLATTATLLAFASDATTLVAVGTAGTILLSQPAQSAPTIVTSPASITEAAGSHVRLAVTATGTTPLAYQWTFNGQPLSGATADTLTLPAVTASSSGRYAVTVTNALGSSTSPAAILTVIAALPAPTPLIDPSFSTRALNAAPHALLVQPDGKILLGGDNGLLIRLLPDGSPDPTFPSQFAPPDSPPGANAFPIVRALALQTDGKILVAATTARSFQPAQLYRLNTDGTTDSSFVYAPPVLAPFVAQQLLLQPDGKILVVDGTARIYRLNSNGSTDSAFNAPTVPAPDSTPVQALQWLRAALAPDGRIYLLAPNYYTSEFALNPGYVVRLRTDGSLDPTYPNPLRVGPIAAGFEPKIFSVQPDGRLLFAAAGAGLYGGSWTLQRYLADGARDLTFASPSASFGRYGGAMSATHEADGQLVVISRVGNPPSWSITRYTTDGLPAQTLAAPADLPRPDELGLLCPLPDGRLLFTSSTSINDVRQRILQRLVARNVPLPANSPIILDEPAPPLVLRGGSPLSLRPTAAGTAPFTTRWNVSSLDATTAPDGTLTIDAVRTDTTYEATLSNAAGTITAPPRLIIAAPQAPLITRQPTNQTADLGRAAAFSVSSLGSGTLTYEWFHNGVSLGASDNFPGSSTLIFYSLQPADAGTYYVVITNTLGSTTSATFNLTVDTSSRLANVSTRAWVGRDEQALIVGFSIVGPSAKSITLRAAGPSLAPFGVTGFVSDPLLTLYDSTGTPLATNDSWLFDSLEGDYNAISMFPLDPAGRDARLTRRLPPGNYTARLSTADGTTGLALAEIYEDNSAPGRLTNLSTRAWIGPGTQLAIPGVVVRGTRPQTLLLRAVGPTLAQFGVQSPLANPSLALVDSTGTTLATNSDWETNSNLPALRTTTASVGAFALPAGSRDAALLVTVPPGSYTALVTGTPDTTGVALVEVYAVP